MMPTNKNWWLYFGGLAFALVYPSLAIFKKLGAGFVIGYALIATFALFVLLRALLPRLKSRISERQAIIIALLLIAAIAVAHFVIYPSIDVNGFSLSGIQFGSSDSDNALNVALDELMVGRYPYHATTYFANPLTPMPGALLLALPFYLVGVTTLQNFIWIAIALFLFIGEAKHRTSAALFFVAVPLLSPNNIYHLIHGGDYLTNGISVLVFLVLILRGVEQRRSTWRLVMFSTLLGIALSSRFLFLTVVPAFALLLFRSTDRKRASLLVTTTLLSYLVITLPFYLSDPAGFSPLHTLGKLHGDAIHPAMNFVVVAVSLGVSIVAGIVGSVADRSRLFRWLYGACAIPLILGLVFDSIVRGFLNVHFAHFGLLVAVFGVFGFCLPLFASKERGD